MTDQEIRNLAYESGMVTKWNRPGYGPDFHDYIFTFARAVIAAQLAAPVAAQEPTDLHAAIMNLPCNPPSDEINFRAYREGHKDARHAAAELIASQPAQGERHKVPCTSRDAICPQPAYCHANGCKVAQGERQPVAYRSADGRSLLFAKDLTGQYATLASEMTPLYE